MCVKINCAASAAKRAHVMRMDLRMRRARGLLGVACKSWSDIPLPGSLRAVTWGQNSRSICAGFIGNSEAARIGHGVRRHVCLARFVVMTVKTSCRRSRSARSATPAVPPCRAGKHRKPLREERAAGRQLRAHAFAGKRRTVQLAPAWDAVGISRG